MCVCGGGGARAVGRAQCTLDGQCVALHGGLGVASAEGAFGRHALCEGLGGLLLLRRRVLLDERIVEGLHLVLVLGVLLATADGGGVGAPEASQEMHEEMLLALGWVFVSAGPVLGEHLADARVLAGLLPLAAHCGRPVPPGLAAQLDGRRREQWRFAVARTTT